MIASVQDRFPFRCRDEFHRQATEVVDMGAGTIDLLLRFLQQNEGRLSKRAREREFAR